MLEVRITDSAMQAASSEGFDAFIEVVRKGIMDAIGGELTAESMAELNSDQMTLIAYCMFREEVMDGGFVQLIYNGLGGFIFRNPFDRAIMAWGLTDLGRLVRKGHKLYNKYHSQIEREMSDEEFMALFEKMPEFDDLDDTFVANEEQWTAMVAYYMDENLDRFVTIE